MRKVINFIKNCNNYKNQYFIRYHLSKFFDRLLFNLHLKKLSGNNQKDMFNWDKYNLHFRGEVFETSKIYTIELKKDDYKFENNRLVKINQSIKDIHPLHTITYETIMQLNPSSVFEMGSGHGMHLNNLQVLNPELKLAGIDRSAKQIEFMWESFPDLKADVKTMDATIPFNESMYGLYDLSFTNAVIMHIHFADTHKIALANLFNVSKKYVILSERWKNHNFMTDIKELHNKKIIRWNEIYFYYKRFEDADMYNMICSNEPLPYTDLDNYDLLPKN